MPRQKRNQKAALVQLDEGLQLQDVPTNPPKGSRTPKSPRRSFNGNASDRRPRPGARRRGGRRRPGLDLISVEGVIHVTGSHRKTRIRKSSRQSNWKIAEQMLVDERQKIDKRLDFERMIALATEWLSPKPVLPLGKPVLAMARLRPVVSAEDQTGRLLVPDDNAHEDPTKPLPVAEGTERTVWEACDHYLTNRLHSDEHIKLVERIRSFIGRKTKVKDVNDDLLLWLRTKMLRESSGIQTYKRNVVTPVKTIMRYAAAVWGAPQGCPVPNFLMIPEGKRRIVTLLPTHAEKLVTLAENSGYRLLADILPFGLCEGPRSSEMFDLMWEDIDRDHGLITLRNTKSKPGEQRQRVIGNPRPRTWIVLEALLARRGWCSGPVFVDPTRRGFDTNGRGFSSPATMARMLNAQLKELGETLKLPDPITLHVLRHTAASYHYLVEPDFLRVQKRMDWKDIKSTTRYVHEMDESLKEAVKSFWNPG